MFCNPKEFGVYMVFVANAMIVHELVYCDVTRSEAISIINDLEKEYPERIFYYGEVELGQININLN